MAIIINYHGASLKRPGAYSFLKVADSGVAEAQLGIVAIIGEADEGDSFASDAGGLDANTFTPDGFSLISNKFVSGPLVDAAKIALAPSGDTQILGGAQQLILLKTNASVEATLALPSSYGSVEAKSAGAPGNRISVEIDVAGSQDTITITRSDTGLSEVSSPLGGHNAIQIQASGAGVTAATLTITATNFTTSITGGSTPSLNLPLSQFSTLKSLVDYLNTISGYSASVSSSDQNNQPLSVMDRVTAVNIFTAPYNVLRDAEDVRDFFATSTLVDLIPTSYVGIPAAMPRTFLSGGARGATSQAAIQACLDALLKIRVNFIVPLFSRDASAGDIAAGLTDAASTYAIDSIHAAVSSHCAQSSTIKGRKERQGFIAFKGSYATTKLKSGTTSNARIQLHLQDVDVLSAQGSIYLGQPHFSALIGAALKAAAPVGLANTFKQPNISGFSHLDFDPETQGDDAIDNNICFIEKAPGGGFRYVLDNSTYGQTQDAWIYNRPSVLYAADTAALAIRLNTETFVGKRNSDVSEETISNLLINVMDSLRASGIIVPDKNTNGKGYKDLSVRFVGSVINTSVTLALVEDFEFVLNDIQVQRAVG
jgi:hypothetical protein